MTCPVCGGDTMVFNSRPRPETVFRRRECLTCGHRFTTYEVDAELYQKLTWSIDALLENSEAKIQGIIHVALDQIKASLFSDCVRHETKMEDINGE